jgi:hypothetical protein
MPAPESTDPGPWAGHQQAFAVIASHCSAAQAHCLKKARDSRAFEPLGLTWDQYAKRHFGISRSQADSLIRLLDQFGESYFHISQLARIGPAAYSRIADRLKDGRLHFDGEQLEIAPENAPKIRAAIDTLRAEWKPPQKLRPKPAPSAAPPVPAPELEPLVTPAVLPPVSCDSNPSLPDPAASLDDWHHAASVSDEDRFFSHFTADARILGVCPSERWTLSRFRIWAEPRFEDPAAWTYTPLDRSITFSADRNVAWFDELLSLPSHKPNYGSGVLVRQNGTWKIALYHFATPILDPYLPENVQFGTSSRVK